MTEGGHHLWMVHSTIRYERIVPAELDDEDEDEDEDEEDEEDIEPLSQLLELLQKSSMSPMSKPPAAALATRAAQRRYNFISMRPLYSSESVRR